MKGSETRFSGRRWTNVEAVPRDESELAWHDEFGHVAQQHGHPGSDVLESRMLGRGGGCKSNDDRNFNEGAEGGASQYLEQHELPGRYVFQSGTATSCRIC